MRNKRLSHFLLVVSSGICLTRGATAQVPAIPFDKIQIITTRLAPHFYALTCSAGLDPGHPEGAGGRFGVLVGSDGVFMVDGSYAPLSEKIAASIHALCPGPIRFLVNTHEHPDHTGGNPNFARMGAVVIARQETREALVRPMPPAIAAAIGNAASNDDPARLPMITVGANSVTRLFFDGETIDLIPLAPAHTNGDLMVRFEKEDIIMVGDFYRNYGYPFVDLSHGGSFKGVVAAIDTLLVIAGPHTQLVPGHGSIVNREALAAYKAMILDIQKKVRTMVTAGKTKAEALAARLTASYDDRVPGGTQPLPAGLGTSADRFVGTIYDEIKHEKLEKLEK